MDASLVCKLYLNKVYIKGKRKCSVCLEHIEGSNWVLIWVDRALYSPEYLVEFRGRSYVDQAFMNLSMKLSEAT